MDFVLNFAEKSGILYYIRQTCRKQGRKVKCLNGEEHHMID